MVSRDKIVKVDGVKYTLHLALELGNDVWNVRIYYRRSTHESFRLCKRSDCLYAEFASFVSAEWVDRVYRDYMAACFNVHEFVF